MLKVGEIPVVTFFSGTSLPRYARKSLSHLSKMWPAKVHLLTDIPGLAIKPTVEVEHFSPWFSTNRYANFVRDSPLDGNFRQGFWLKTALRFFVIAEWMELSGVDRVLHLELDCALQNIEGMEKYLHSLRRGVYLPWVSTDVAIASIVYFHGLGPVKELAEFMAANAELGNEMNILARFLKLRPDIAFGLPSPLGPVLSGSERAPAPNQLPANFESGVFDAAQIGHWLFGPDPANIRGHLVRANYEFNYGDESKRRFRQVAGRLVLRAPSRISLASGAAALPVRNLHVHSKAIGNAYRPWLLRFHFRRSKLDRNSVVLCWPKPVPFAKSRLKRRLDIALIRVKKAYRGVDQK